MMGPLPGGRLRLFYSFYLVDHIPVQHLLRSIDLDYQRLRRWCRESRKIVIVYQDRNGVETQRTVWPFMMGLCHRSASGDRMV